MIGKVDIFDVSPENRGKHSSTRYKSLFLTERAELMSEGSVHPPLRAMATNAHILTGRGGGMGKREGCLKNRDLIFLVDSFESELGNLALIQQIPGALFQSLCRQVF